MTRQIISSPVDRHRLLTSAAIPQDDGIEDVTTLDASCPDTLQVARAVHEVHGDFVHHEPATSQAG